MHGKTSPVEHDGKGLFAGLPQPREVGRYHSLIARPDTLPAELEVTARTPEGEIMGVRHRTLKVEGVQFHPESVLTPDGPALIGNFLQACAEAGNEPARHARAPAVGQISERDRGGRAAARAHQRRHAAAAGRRAAGRVARQGCHAPKRCAASRAPCAGWRASRQSRRRRMPSTSSVPAAIPRAASICPPAPRCSPRPAVSTW